MNQVLKGIIRYDGTDFAGWQRQLDRRTVQGELEAALSRIADAPVAVQGAGRTDAGVHALGQVFSCQWHRPYLPRMRHALCKMLGPEIRVIELGVAPPGFNARFDAVAKRYIYTFDLNSEPDPFSARYAWHMPFKLDLELLESLLPALCGTRDFSGFQSTGTQMESTVRTLYSISLHAGGLISSRDQQNLYRLEFHGNGFLYKMVRNITGSLVEVARKRFQPEFIVHQLQTGGPFRGHCAPPRGLALAEVQY